MDICDSQVPKIPKDIIAAKTEHGTELSAAGTAGLNCHKFFCRIHFLLALAGDGCYNKTGKSIMSRTAEVNTSAASSGILTLRHSSNTRADTALDECCGNKPGNQ